MLEISAVSIDRPVTKLPCRDVGHHVFRKCLESSREFRWWCYRRSTRKHDCRVHVSSVYHKPSARSLSRRASCSSNLLTMISCHVVHSCLPGALQRTRWTRVSKNSRHFFRRGGAAIRGKPRITKPSRAEPSGRSLGELIQTINPNKKEESPSSCCFVVRPHSK